MRLTLTDSLWARLLSAIKETSAYLTENLRMVVEGILWRFRTGAPWRDLPRFFGPWKTVFNRFNTWSKSGVWRRLFEMLRGELDNEWNFMDGTYIKVHQHACGGIEAGDEKSIGRSKGGNTTKVHMLADGLGNPVTFEITAGNIHDVSVGSKLIAASEGENIIGDKGYDSEALRDSILAKNATPHIPRKSNSQKPNPQFDKYLYRHRHLVENLFQRLKHFRAFATRYDKLTRNFSSSVFIGCTLIWLKL
jgi:transposase